MNEVVRDACVQAESVVFDREATIDKLGALEPKRRATCAKYPDRENLVAALEARVKEAAKTPQSSAPPPSQPAQPQRPAA